MAIGICVAVLEIEHTKQHLVSIFRKECVSQGPERAWKAAASAHVYHLRIPQYQIAVPQFHNRPYRTVPCTENKRNVLAVRHSENIFDV